MDDKPPHRADFREARPGANGSASEENSGDRPVSQLPRSKGGKPRKGLPNAAARGVEDAYRLIEKHILEGRRVAQETNQRTYGVSGDRFDLLEGFVRRSAHLLGVVAECAASIATSDRMRTLFYGSRPQSRSSAEAASMVDGLSVEIISTRPTHVTLDLRAGSEPDALAISSLHASDPHNPPLSDVAISRNHGEGHVAVRIRVSPEQPSDVYSGPLIDGSSGELRGTLTVRIGG